MYYHADLISINILNFNISRKRNADQYYCSLRHRRGCAWLFSIYSRQPDRNTPLQLHWTLWVVLIYIISYRYNHNSNSSDKSHSYIIIFYCYYIRLRFVCESNNYRLNAKRIDCSRTKKLNSFIYLFFTRRNTILASIF